MRLSLNAQIACGAVVGILAGILLGHANLSSDITLPLITGFKISGQIFIGLLKMILAPLIFTSVAVGIANLRHVPHPGRAWPTLIAFFTTSTTLAIITGLAAVNFFKPGKGQSIDLLSEKVTSIQAQTVSASDLIQGFLNTIFVNHVTAMANNNILAIIVFAIGFGVAMMVLKERSQAVYDFTNGFFEITMVIVGWIMRLAPFGIMGLLAALAAEQDVTLLSVMAKYIAVVLGATLFHGIITLPLLLWITTRRNPIEFFMATREALMTAFATCSSSATLPVGLRCVTENLKVNKNIAGFVLPVGATLNMDGTALYEAIAALFIANLCGIELSITQQLIVALTAMLASVGAPGIPSAGMVTMIMVLQSVGLPGEAVAILIPVDRLLDTVRTAVNVQGDYIAACVVEKHSL
jgi:Na+/H+-dicarboxylate symporter